MRHSDAAGHCNQPRQEMEGVMPASCTTLAAKPQTDAETEATAASTAIAGLRRRLSHQGVIEHPAVLRELRKLEEQLAAQLDGAGCAQGRHRSPAEAPGAGHDIGSSRDPGHDGSAHRARQARRAVSSTETS